MPRTASIPLRVVIAGIASLLGMLACIDPAHEPTPPPTGPVALAIVGPDREVNITCVTLEGSEVTGRELLKLAGVQVTLDERNAMGALVCAINEQGCAYPAEQCLCQCEGLTECAYWASFVRIVPGAWTYAGQGVSTQQLRPGDSYAWVWLPTASRDEAQTLLYDDLSYPLCP